MAVQCPKCGCERVALVGQYSKLVKWGFAGAGILILLAVALPVFWLVLPVWMLGSIWLYLTRPLLACRECNHLWDPRKPEAQVKVGTSGRH